MERKEDSRTERHVGNKQREQIQKVAFEFFISPPIKIVGNVSEQSKMSSEQIIRACPVAYVLRRRRTIS
jgi:hypothetical protein